MDQLRHHLHELVQDHDVVVYLLWAGGIGGFLPVALSVIVFSMKQEKAPGFEAIGGAGQLWALCVLFLTASLVYLMTGNGPRDTAFQATVAGAISAILVAIVIWAMLTARTFEKGQSLDTFQTVVGLLGLPSAFLSLWLGAVGVNVSKP